MQKLVLRRSLLAIGLILAASAAIFALISAAPGNVAALIAERAAGPGADAQMIARIADDLGLNDPFPMRYGAWLVDALTGDFGISPRTGKPIAEELARRIPTTGTLLAGGGLITLLLSFGMILAGATSNGEPPDRVLHGFSLIGASTPNFFVATMLVIVFSI